MLINRKVSLPIKRLIGALIASLFLSGVSAPSSFALSTTTLSFDADDAIKTGESATATLTFNMTGTSVDDSATVRVFVTSSNSQYVGNLYMIPSDSFTNLTVTKGTTTTSPRLLYGNSQDSVNGVIAGNIGNGYYNALPYILMDSSNAGNIATGTNLDSSTVQLSYGATATVKYTVGLYNVSTAGTYTVRAESYTRDVNNKLQSVGGSSATWTVTVTAADKTASASSTVTLRQGDKDNTDATYLFGGTKEGGDSATLRKRSSTSTSTTPEFSLYVVQRSASGTNIARESFTVTVAGEAWVGSPTDTTTRPNSGNGVKSKTFAAASAGTATEVWLWSTGTAGTATVSVVTASGLTLGTTKTLTFHGDVATLTVDVKYKNVIRAATNTAQTAVVDILAKDSGGRAVTGLTIAGVSSNNAVIASGSCSDEDGYDTSTRDGYYVCSLTPSLQSKSADKATITWRTADLVTDPTGNTYITTTQDFTMGGAVSTVVLSTDKATYEPGEYMVITATAKDSSGNTPYDGQSGPSLTANKSLGSSSITMNTYLQGVSTSQTRSALDPAQFTNSKNLYAPAASGKFTISGVDGQTTPAAISVTATVSDDGATAAASAATDAALEAIDAANAATDAANLAAEAADAATVAAEEARDAADAATAAVEALATEVATLMAALKAQITTLANTVAKIAKKVKA